MRNFILIAKRHDGKDVLLSGREASPTKQIESFKKMASNLVSDDYVEALLLEVIPAKKVLRFVKKDEADKAKAAAEAKAKADAEAKEKADAEAKAKNDNNKKSKK